MHVAFFRNLNLGQPRSPSRAQLLEAFAAEGARDVLSTRPTGRSPSSATATCRPSHPVATRRGHAP